MGSFQHCEQEHSQFGGVFRLLEFGAAASLKIPPVISTNAQSNCKLDLYFPLHQFHLLAARYLFLHQVVAGIEKHSLLRRYQGPQPGGQQAKQDPQAI